jgi:hypothetical protein
VLRTWQSLRYGCIRSTFPKVPGLCFGCARGCLLRNIASDACIKPNKPTSSFLSTPFFQIFLQRRFVDSNLPRRSLGTMLHQVCKHLRLAGLLLAAVAGLLTALLAVHQFVLPVIGWIFPSLESTFFDLAVYGGYPQRNYVSHNLTSPDLQQVKWDDRCDNGFIFISPQGPSVEHPGPMILDARGNLVWQSDQYGKPMNLRVQEYKGEKYLTFWAGLRGSSFGYGNYYMVSTLNCLSPTLANTLSSSTLRTKKDTKSRPSARASRAISTNSP